MANEIVELGGRDRRIPWTRAAGGTVRNSPRLGQTSTQPLQDDFAERWSAAMTAAAKAQLEQEYLTKFAAGASTLEAEYAAEKARQPFPRAGVFSLVVDYADSARKFLENAAQVMPTGFPAGPARGLSWDAPAQELVRRFAALTDQACATLAAMEAPAGPPVATPRVCPQRPPRPGESDLPSGEPGGRPRTFLDDALDWLLEESIPLALLAAWGAATYLIVDASESEAEDRRRREVGP